MDQLSAIERRRRNLRIVLFTIILATLPLYCLGILLWGTSPQRNALNRTPTATITSRSPTNTLLPNVTPSITPIFNATATNPLQATPTQYVPFPTFLFPTLTLTPTTFLFPSATFAPTLTPITPTWTPITPTVTNTLIPIPTATFTLVPPPTSPPFPTATELPPPTPSETPTVIPP